MEGVFGYPNGELPYFFVVLSAVEDKGEIPCPESNDGGSFSECVFGSAVFEDCLLPFLLDPLGDVLVDARTYNLAALVHELCSGADDIALFGFGVILEVGDVLPEHVGELCEAEAGDQSILHIFEESRGGVGCACEQEVVVDGHIGGEGVVGHVVLPVVSVVEGESVNVAFLRPNACLLRFGEGVEFFCNADKVFVVGVGKELQEFGDGDIHAVVAWAGSWVFGLLLAVFGCSECVFVVLLFLPLHLVLCVDGCKEEVGGFADKGLACRGWCDDAGHEGEGLLLVVEVSEAYACGEGAEDGETRHDECRSIGLGYAGADFLEHFGQGWEGGGGLRYLGFVFDVGRLLLAFLYHFDGLAEERCLVGGSCGVDGGGSGGATLLEGKSEVGYDTDKPIG